MAKINEALVLLNDLIHSNVDDMIKMSKDALCNIQSCSLYAHEKIEFLQLESQLQQDELQQKSHHSEPVSVQKIVKDSHQKKEDKVADDSHWVHCTRADLHAYAATQPALPKPIIRPWEELVHNKHRTGLGYDKDVTFHIPDYTKPIKFQSAGFMYDSSPAAVPNPVHFHNRLRNANTVIELSIWNITVLIFIHASTVVGTLILHTDASDTSLLQEPRFILDGSLLGNGHQQPRRCLRHMLELVHAYWANLQLSFRHHLTLSLTGGKMVVMYKLRRQIKRAWATISHSMFRVVASNSSEPEPQFVIPDSEM